MGLLTGVVDFLGVLLDLFEAGVVVGESGVVDESISANFDSMRLAEIG